MKKLHEGLTAYRTGYHRENQQLFDQLKAGQQPEVLFITCSDSRVSPAHMTQCGPGELFVIRNAGNMIPSYAPSAHGGGEAGTVEYAVAVLGVRHIVVCGHSGCGAMKGLLHPETLTELPVVAEWLKQAEATRRSVAAEPEDERLTRAIEHNAVQQLRNLKTHPAVVAKLAGGGLQLHAWVYDIGSGEIRAYDESTGAFRALN